MHILHERRRFEALWQENLKFAPPPDLSRRTMQKCEEQVPELLAARRMGKTAYFILDKLIIRDAKKPPEISQHEGNAGNDSEQEISFRS